MSWNEKKIYRWNFPEEKQLDEDEKAKRKKRGIGVYSAVMISAFALCFLALIGALVWYEAFGSVEARSKSIAEISESVSPATVLLAAQCGDGTYYGTGFIFRSDGYIATTTSLLDGTISMQAQLYGSDAWIDVSFVGISEEDSIVVLKLDAGVFSDYPCVSFGNSDSVKVGDSTTLISHLGGDAAPWSVTSGIFSSVDRTLQLKNQYYLTEYNLFQIDAKMTAESSGAPVCNSFGEVVGMAVGQLYGTDGAGLIMPINGVRMALEGILGEREYDPLCDSLLQHTRPLLGISCLEITSSDFASNASIKKDGIFVAEVTMGSPASGKLYVGDVIVSCNGIETPTMDVFTDLLYGCRSGDTVHLEVIRNDKIVKISIRFP